MDAIKNFTKRSMGRNKKRTIVTIIGVMLSAALICAVAGMAATFRDGMINFYETKFGSFYGRMENVPVENISLVTDNAHVVSAGVAMPVGTASIEEAGVRERKYNDNPYIALMAFDDVAFENVALNVVSGRLPENDTEILMNEYIMPDDWKVGDKITLNLGHRVLFGEDVACDGTYYNSYNINDTLGISEDEETIYERIEDKTAREYTIVGIMEEPNTMVQRYGSGSTICITRMKDVNTFSAYRDTKAFTANVYFTYDSARKYGDYTEEITRTVSNADINSKENDSIEKAKDADYTEDMAKFAADNIFDLRPDVYVRKNDLVKFYGGLGNEAAKAVGVLAAIIIMIIVVTSVFVISNSFRISVSEKKIQLGMLSSIGATKRQIKKIVLREGLYIWAAGTTLGILLGVMVVGILTFVVQRLVGETLNMNFRFVFPWWVTVIVIVMSAITIYFACIIPARAASKISPIEAIRGNQEIKIKGKKLKTLKITKKLFGVGGEIAAKNLKRSRRSYRTTVVSLVIGVATFIAINSFINYAKAITGLMYIESGYDIRVVDYGYDINDKYDELNKVKHLEGVGDLAAEKMVFAYLPKEYVNDSLESAYEQDDYNINFIIYDSDYFAKFIDEVGIKTDDPSKVAILEDDYIERDDKGYEKKHFIKEKKIDSIPVKIYSVEDDPSETSPLFEEDIKITARSEKRPMGMEGENIGAAAYIIVSEDYFGDKIDEAVDGFGMFINSDTPDELYKDINDMLASDSMKDMCYIQNVAEEREHMGKLVLMVSIFLYGFIIVTMLIGVTNIFNTIHTNMNLRAKEFAMLKSVGMTGHEFNRMIRLESIMYGMKSLLIGLPLGVILSYAIYSALSIEISLGYSIPVLSMIIAILFVIIIIWMTMHLSFSKIKKQNIIETIRKQTY